MYLDSPKDSIDNLLELISEFGKTVKYKINKNRLYSYITATNTK